jgi:hypothetical protein
MIQSKPLPLSLTTLVEGLDPTKLPHIEWVDIDTRIPLMQGSSVTIKELDGVVGEG